jgi:hypothetical protein
MFCAAPEGGQTLTSSNLLHAVPVSVICQAGAFAMLMLLLSGASLLMP